MEDLSVRAGRIPEVLPLREDGAAIADIVVLRVDAHPQEVGHHFLKALHQNGHEQVVRLVAGVGRFLKPHVAPERVRQVLCVLRPSNIGLLELGQLLQPEGRLVIRVPSHPVPNRHIIGDVGFDEGTVSPALAG